MSIGYISCYLLLTTLLSPVWCIVSSGSLDGYLEIGPICGGQTGNTFDCLGSEVEEDIRTLVDRTMAKLCDVTAYIGEIIREYKQKRVKFTYRASIDGCFHGFHISAGYNERTETDLFLHAYHDVLNIIALIHLITTEDTERSSDAFPLAEMTYTTEMHLNEVLCSMNKALRKLGHHGEETCRTIYIQQTSTNCTFASNLNRYVRDLEVFRTVKSDLRQLYDKFYVRDNCPQILTFTRIS